TAEVPLQLAGTGARRFQRELDPAVFLALDDAQRVERRLGAATVEPGEQLLEPRFHPERARLVDDSRAGFESEDPHAAATAVRVAGLELEHHQVPRLGSEQVRAQRVL